MLNTLSSVSVQESRIQYLCDPQWFRDTASRGPTTIVAPKSQFRTCPTDHGPRSETRILHQPALEDLTNLARTETSRKDDRNKSDHNDGGTWRSGGSREVEEGGGGHLEARVVSRIQLAVGPQPLWLRNHNFGLSQRIMVKRLATSPHDPLGSTDSVCKNHLVVVSVQYGPFNTYIPIRSTTIGKSRVARDPITMHTSWRSNNDIASVTRQTHLPKTHPVLWPEIYHTIVSSDSIGYPCMTASGESSTTKHRLLHASGPHPIPPPNDPKTNQYNQDLGLIHSTNGNHLESLNEGSSIDHQVTIHLHAQNITMFPTNETWYFTSHMLVSSSGGLILILTAQSTRNEFRIHSDY
ncbi:hypothetical protein F511_31564 [Dorcoceras hygrometricum]|uniref:Uncharacterized protein n=1 Tax=Dorcoceras hygrometricum TaxID=472368 RepID=A0A2Z7AVH5_9LAMI|nr:hypothetical protein F511_31564 [Dorcoceras hygrometricum]